MRICVQDGLPFASVALTYSQRSIVLERVLIDTGSAGTILAVDKIDVLELFPEPDDLIYQVLGVGGSEYVFSKTVDALVLGDLEVRDFAVEFGAMRYGVDLDGIIGLDFLLQVEAVIDLKHLEIHRSSDR